MLALLPALVACSGTPATTSISPTHSPRSSTTKFAFEQQKCGEGPDTSSDEQPAVVVADADGSHQATVVPLGGVVTHPGGEISLSPADDEIAFGTPDGRLPVVHADGSGLRTIALPTAGFAYGPAWSPDAKWILVAINAGQGADLYVVAADGTNSIRLTKSPGDEVYTDWSVAP